MSDWWRAVDDQLRRLGDQAPDPWADIAVPDEDSALTPEQRAFLTQLADTPALRLEDGDLERADLDESI
jgi:hypothetical protein